MLCRPGSGTFLPERNGEAPPVKQTDGENPRSSGNVNDKLGVLVILNDATQWSVEQFSYLRDTSENAVVLSVRSECRVTGNKHEPKQFFFVIQKCDCRHPIISVDNGKQHRGWV